MFREEFAKCITESGVMTLKEIRPYTLSSNSGEISERKLLNSKIFDQVKFAEYASNKFSVVFLDLSSAKVSDDILTLAQRNQLILYRCIPIQKTTKSVTLAIYDPTIKKYEEELKRIFGVMPEFILTNLNAWFRLFDLVPQSIDEIANTVREVKEKEEQDLKIKEEDIGDEVIRYVNKIMAESFIRGVSDIHLEPYEKIFRIRFRIDGTLIEVSRPPIGMMLPIISRIKIMAKLDISERRKPQDGRIKLIINNKPIDYRVSSLPTLFGEKMVLRLLDTSNLQLDMTKLGFTSDQIERFQAGIHKPYGMCLVTGPTGSGKTTTLYSALAELNTVGKNISTAEDPVEFNLEGINQVNVKKDIGLTFAASLKSFLRQDPDIIMVGEIRDYETGEIAVEASLTGHMVLSTLHTNDAPSTITRLLNMGVEAFLLVASLNVIVAQRLCRKICIDCKELNPVDPKILVSSGISAKSAENMKVYRGKGCKTCNNTGHKGRIAIYEVLQVSISIKELILKNASSEEIKRQAIREGMKTLRMSALMKVAQGQTSLEEAISNSSSD